MLSETDGIFTQENGLIIQEFGSSIREVFYKQMKRFVHPVNTESYWKYFPNDDDIAKWRARIHHDSNHHGVVEDPIIAINTDRLQQWSEAIPQCIERHELAEIWSYARKGQSLDKMIRTNRIEFAETQKIAHRFARIEEIRFAFEHGYQEELREFALLRYPDIDEFDLYYQYFKDGVWS